MVPLTIAAVLALTPLLILPAYFFYFDVTPKVARCAYRSRIGLLLFLRESALAQARRLWADPVGRWFCVLAAAQLVSLLLSTVLLQQSPAFVERRKLATAWALFRNPPSLCSDFL